MCSLFAGLMLMDAFCCSFWLGPWRTLSSCRILPSDGIARESGTFSGVRTVEIGSARTQVDPIMGRIRELFVIFVSFCCALFVQASRFAPGRITPCTI
jgi:hypothetical protein